jgi:hypothetical protein
MGGALGIGTPTFNPAAAGLYGNPWTAGGSVGVQAPQVVQALQQLLHIKYAEQQHLQQLAQLVPQQMQLIQHLIQFVAHQQQPYPQQPYPLLQPQLQSFGPIGSTPSLGGQSGWFGTQAAQQPLFGGPPGYVM